MASKRPLARPGPIRRNDEILPSAPRVEVFISILMRLPAAILQDSSAPRARDLTADEVHRG